MEPLASLASLPCACSLSPSSLAGSDRGRTTDVWRKLPDRTTVFRPATAARCWSKPPHFGAPADAELTTENGPPECRSSEAVVNNPPLSPRTHKSVGSLFNLTGVTHCVDLPSGG